MQTCAAGYALTYVTIPKLRLVSRTVVGLYFLCLCFRLTTAVSCIISLCSRTRKGCRKSRAIHGVVCTSQSQSHIATDGRSVSQSVSQK
jgi:hypothetical protein